MSYSVDDHPRGPEELKAAAKALGFRGVTDLLALARGNDPYLFGTAADWRDARWFAGLWEHFGYTTGVHLRRVHYQVFSTRGTTATGETYQNTDKCWSGLLSAGKAARVLGLVDPEAFVDRRNDPPRLHVTPRVGAPEPSCGWLSGLGGPDDWSLPEISDWDLAADFALGSLAVGGYDYEPADQPVLLEVWIEKSTMDDVLVPVCRSRHVNLLSGSGFQSITAVIDLLRRAERHDKPAHVIYVSDFDPAGVVMPVSVARQAQFWADTLKIDAELTIDAVALTRDQVDRYDLPRAPVKVDKNGVKDRRGKRFEDAYGAGIVELDALEALHPGSLAQLVRHAIQPYQDATLSSRLATTGYDSQTLADEIWGESTADLRGRRDHLQAEVNAVADRYRDRIGELAAELAAELEPYRGQLDVLRMEANQLSDELATEANGRLAGRPTAEDPDVDRDAMLYDSDRPWLDQLEAYRAAKGGTA